MNKILLTAFMLFTTSLFAQTWEALGNAIAARHHPISFSLDGKGYAVTGSSTTDQPTNDVYEYNPDTDTWTTLTDFPGSVRSFGIGAVTNGIAYVGFGASSNQYLNDLWSFDGTTWTQLASCGCTGRRHPAMIAIGDKIYVGLGDDASGNRKDWWMYDITLNTWTQTADFPGLVRHHPYMFNAGGEVFAGLGHGNNGIYGDWYKLDTSLNTWTAMAQFPGEARVAGTQFSIGEYGYVLSGDGDDHNYMNTGEMWRYDPSTDTWLMFPSHPGRSKWAPGSFVIDKDIYFFGGLDRFSGTFPAEVWKFADTTTAPMDTTVVDTTTSIRGGEAPIAVNTYLYPNPASNFVSWETDISITDIKIYNSLGQLVLSSKTNVKQVNTDNFNEGIYIVQFFKDSKLIKTSKLLIRH